MTERGRQLLEEKIKASGLKKEYLLQQMHLKSMTSFSNKLSGTTEFTAGEIAALADSLRLTVLPQSHPAMATTRIDYSLAADPEEQERILQRIGARRGEKYEVMDEIQTGAVCRDDGHDDVALAGRGSEG